MKLNSAYAAFRNSNNMAVQANRDQPSKVEYSSSTQNPKSGRNMDVYGYPDIVVSLGPDHRFYIPPKRYTQTQDDPLTWVRSDSLSKMTQQLVEEGARKSVASTPQKEKAKSNVKSTSEGSSHPNFGLEYSIIAKQHHGRHSDVDEIELLLKAIGSAGPKGYSTGAKLDTYLKSFTKSMSVESKGECEAGVFVSQEDEVQIIGSAAKAASSRHHESKEINNDLPPPQFMSNEVVESKASEERVERPLPPPVDNIQIQREEEMEIDDEISAPLSQALTFGNYQNRSPVKESESIQSISLKTSSVKSANKEAFIPTTVDLIESQPDDALVRAPSTSVFKYHKIRRQSSKKLNGLPPLPMVSPVNTKSPFLIMKEANNTLRVKVKPESLRSSNSDDRPVTKTRSAIEPRKMFLMLSKELRRKF